MQKRILIFGINGQDGRYLTEELLKNNKEITIHGVVRKIENVLNIEGYSPSYLKERLHFHVGDLIEGVWVHHLICQIKPHVIYNMAGQTSVPASFRNPINTLNANAIGVINLLEAIRYLADVQQIKLFQPLSSEMFGKLPEGTVIDEGYIMNPQSPYAVSKVTALQMIRVYRKAYKLSISTAVLFNHESPRRGENFVARKITKYAAKVYLKLTTSPLQLGTIDSLRDWGHARDYVQAFILMMDLKESGDFVICTGVPHSVRDLVEQAFKLVGVTLKWRGQGLKEEGYCSQTGKVYVVMNEQFYRPNKAPFIMGNSKKLQQATSWKPETSFESLIKQMVENDIKLESSVKHPQEKS